MTAAKGEPSLSLATELEAFADSVECTEPGVVRAAAKRIDELLLHLAAAADERNEARIAASRWHAWYVTRFGAAFPPESERPPRVLQLKSAIAAWGYNVARQLFPIHVCTAADPWTPEKDDRAQHPDAVEVGEQENGWPGGDIQRYACPHCKHTWKSELPQ